MKHIKLFLIDGAMVALMYFGLVVGNVYAENLFWPIFWVFVALSFILMTALTNDEMKVAILKNRKPNPVWKEKYSFTYDLLFSLSLAALGFHWSGAIWFIVSLFTCSLVKEEDKKIRESSKAQSNKP